MPYCTQKDIEERIGTQALRKLCICGACSVRAVTLHGEPYVMCGCTEDAIATAGSFIDRLLITRYCIPLNPVPPGIKERAICIAIYFLHRSSGTATAVLRARHKADTAWLERVAANKTGLA